MLIRLLDITDMSLGTPYNTLLVTQNQSAKETERVRREDGWRYRQKSDAEKEEKTETSQQRAQKGCTKKKVKDREMTADERMGEKSMESTVLGRSRPPRERRGTATTQYEEAVILPRK